MPWRFLFAAGAAHAGEHSRNAYSGDQPGVIVYFIHKGDKFTVCDTEYDLMDVYGEYKYERIDGSQQQETHYLATGDGTCFTFDHNFGEDRTVTFRACVDQPVALLPDLCYNWATGIA
ncbi:hypothetical protein [Asanoa siamensis]|uniref:Uncharacterized protein n=1 Tax=Asanoa siamensis TaxID=926357 RepID=A0ABQ4D0L2_9ACTN|nr:hypothetical protein [Asanoa siamensis]GIF77058.1 hypothetical protein Asi02nite_65760 [Asanoa siamensis]